MKRDVVIIGGGMAGYTCALQLARAGKRVSLIERGDIGGTCLNRGCIPTKAMFQTALRFQQSRRNAAFGLTGMGTPGIDFSEVVRRKNSVVLSHRRSVEKLLAASGIELLKGVAEITGPGEVKFSGNDGTWTISAGHLVIATGAEPKTMVDVGGPDLGSVLYSDQLLGLEAVPERMTLIGGGVLGIEFAYIFRVLGAEIQIVEKEGQLLPGMDEAVAREVEKALIDYGIEIFLNSTVTGAESGDLIIRRQGEEIRLPGGVLACSLGRKSCLDGLGLESIGLEPVGGGIVVDEFMRTPVEGVYAIGDVTGRMMVANCARLEGQVAAEHILGQRRPMNYEAIPLNVYIHPEVACVGLTSRQALAAGLDVESVRAPYISSSKSVLEDEVRGFASFVFEKASGRIRGVQVVGYRASDLIGEGALAVSRGLTVDDLAHVAHSHPSLSEVFQEALFDAVTRGAAARGGKAAETGAAPRYSEAVRDALAGRMAVDDRVVLLGEDVADPYGGAFKMTRGLSSRFPDRVLNTPMSESALAGVVAGMALRGMRPVLEIMFGDFITLCMDQIVNHGAKFRWMYNDQVQTPYVIRTPMGGRRGYGPTHSQTLEKILLGIPGLKIVAPSHLHHPGDLLLQAIDDDGPVLFIENKILYPERLKRPIDGYVEQFRCNVDEPPFPAIRLYSAEPDECEVTILAYGGMTPFAMDAAAELILEDEIGCELIIPSCLQPFDDSAVAASVARTGRLAVIEEGTAGYGFTSEMAAAVSGSGLYRVLKAPVARIAALPVPIGCAPPMEETALPSTNTIVEAVRGLF